MNNLISEPPVSEKHIFATLIIHKSLKIDRNAEGML